eukprot:403360218
MEFSNNTFYKQSSIIMTDQYTDLTPAQFRLSNSTFTNNSFAAGGNLIQFSHNSKYEYTITNVSVQQNIQAQINLNPGDTQDSKILQVIHLYNCQFYNNSPLIDAFFRVQSNSRLIVDNSTFEKTYSMSRGGIFLADYQNVTILVRYSNFTNNFASDGGIFYAHYGSSVQFEFCKFTLNYAIEGSIGRVENQGYFRIYNSSITNNHGVRSSIIAIQDSVDQLSIFEDCFFQSNGAYTLVQLFHIIPDQLQQKVLASRGIEVIAQLVLPQYSMSISKASLLVKDCQMINAKNYINAYIGTITLNNITFQDSIIQDTHASLIVMTASIFQIANTTFRNISYQNSLATHNRLMRIDASRIQIRNSSISNIQQPGTYIFEIKRSTSVEITDNNITNFSRNFLYVQLSTVRITRCNFEIKDEFFQLISAKNAIVINRAVYLETSKLSVRSSYFRQTRARQQGGTIYAINTNVNVTNRQQNIFNFLNIKFSSFVDNAASNGGAIQFACSTSAKCQYQIENNYFARNFASIKGGAIYYNKFKPKVYRNNTFVSNYAPYGPNIAGYPYGVRVISYDNYSLASGQDYTGTIQVQVIDPEYNIINTDNTTNVKIEAFDSTYKVSGQTQIKLEMGIGMFNDVEFQAIPGSKNITYKIFATTINTNAISKIFKVDYNRTNETFNQDTVQFNFRDCNPGEINVQSECSLCSGNTFQFDLNEKTCLECPKNAECPGGREIDVNPGYWRSNFYSSNVMQCLLNEACIGGKLSEEYISISNDVQSYPLCKYGYGGNLCHNCLDINGLLFTRIGKHECGLCPSKAGNILKITGIFLALTLALTLLLWVNLRSTRESETSVVIRIFLNYVQILSSAAAFNLEWPVYLQSFFNIFGSVGEISESFISFDCFLQDTGFTKKGSSTFYFKTLVIAILPIIMCFIFAILFYIWKVIKKQTIQNYKRQVIVSTIVVIYTLHPTITRLSTSLFFCMEIDKNEEWLQQDLEIRCWSGQHLLWALSIGIPSLAVWVIGLPTFAFFYFYKKQYKLREPVFFSRYRAVYQGLKQQYFYWEFVNILRKVFLVSVNVFLNLYSGIFKALLSLAVLICFQRVQQRLQPYNNPVINILEQREYTTSIVTFFGALFFVSKEISDIIQLFAFIGILAANIWFILLWGYCFTNTLNFKFTQFIASLLQRFVISQELKQFELEYQSNRKANLNSYGKSEVSSKNRKDPQTGKPSDIFFTSRYTDLSISNIKIGDRKQTLSENRKISKLSQKAKKGQMLLTINETWNSKIKQSEVSYNNQSILKSEKNQHNKLVMQNKNGKNQKQKKVLNNTNLIFGSESIYSESNLRPTATGMHTQIDAKIKLDTQLPLNNKSKGQRFLDVSIPSQIDKDTHSDQIYQSDTVYSFQQQNNSSRIGSIPLGQRKLNKNQQKLKYKTNMQLPSGQLLFQYKLDLVKKIFNKIPKISISSQNKNKNRGTNQYSQQQGTDIVFKESNNNQCSNGKQYSQYMETSQINQQQQNKQMNIIDYSDKLMQKQIQKRKNRHKEKNIRSKKDQSQQRFPQIVNEAEISNKKQKIKNVYDDYPDFDN